MPRHYNPNQPSDITPYYDHPVIKNRSGLWILIAVYALVLVVYVIFDLIYWD